MRRLLLLSSSPRKVQPSNSVISGYFEALACYEWSLYVSPHHFPALYATQPSLSSWEFFTTLDYEWKVIRGRLPYRWTTWVRNNRCFAFVICHALPLADLFTRQIYSIARVSALLGVILCIVIMNVTTPINCQVGTVLCIYSLGLSPATI